MDHREERPGGRDEIDEMVAIIERLMDDGSMHVNVHTNEETQEVKIHTRGTNECAGAACMQPTEKQELSDLKQDRKP